MNRTFGYGSRLRLTIRRIGRLVIYYPHAIAKKLERNAFFCIVVRYNVQNKAPYAQRGTAN